MSNRADSRQHGLHMIKRRQPSATHARKRNKAANRVRQQERQEAIARALVA